ncbi:hypothetical protein [Streptomyces sp. NPDC001820]|uniref:hypothetical protein n=1 Tax=Streptomyces sp. NPDC001820 TaxID=3364613 RepID=UPI00369851B1
MTSQTIPADWPACVRFRFLTIVGATVDVMPQPIVAAPDSHEAFCRGCDASYSSATGVNAELKKWAQAHSETCRALPRPTA